MKLAKVVRHVNATVRPASYKGEKTFLVKPVHPDGREEGSTFVAIDRVQAGLGDLVLILQEGSSARAIAAEPGMPVRTVIVGIVDRVEIAQ